MSVSRVAHGTREARRWVLKSQVPEPIAVVTDGPRLEPGERVEVVEAVPVSGAVPEREAIEALKPYVTPDGYGEGTDKMRRENAERALSKAYPFIARAVRSRLAETLKETGSGRLPHPYTPDWASAADFIESLSDEDLGGRDERD